MANRYSHIKRRSAKFVLQTRNCRVMSVRALSLSHFACVHEIVLHLDPEMGCCIRLFGIDYIKSFRLKFATCCTNYQWFILIRLLFATFCDMQLQIANA